jgi:hypothetical protein
MKMRIAFWGMMVLVCQACNRTVIPNNNIMPVPLRFYLLDKTGASLLASVTTPVRVYAFDQAGRAVYLGSECQGGGCTMIREDATQYHYQYWSLDAALASAAGTKTWYIELGGKTDTLYYDVQETRHNDPLDKYDVVGIKFNGETIALSTPPYTLQRRH